MEWSSYAFQTTSFVTESYPKSLIRGQILFKKEGMIKGYPKNIRDYKHFMSWRVQRQDPKPSVYKKRWPKGSRMDYSSKARKEKITRNWTGTHWRLLNNSLSLTSSLSAIPVIRLNTNVWLSAIPTWGEIGLSARHLA